jgi:hypothetical protein
MRPPRQHQRQQSCRKQDRDPLPVNTGRLAKQPAQNEEQSNPEAEQQ